MRKSEASLAVIRRRNDPSRWLALWNAKWNAYHFVGGHRQPEETFRECMARELAEELDLIEGNDCTVGVVPLAHLEYTAWSNHAKAETQYTMELFAVELGKNVEQALEKNPEIVWLSSEEIRNEKCHDGRAISPTMGLLIGKAKPSFGEEKE